MPELDTWGEIQPAHYTPSEHSHLRSAVMNRTNEMELLKRKRSGHAAANSEGLRKTSDAVQLEKPDVYIAKRLKTVKPKTSQETKPTPAQNANLLTLLSTDTMRKLQVFRFKERCVQPKAVESESDSITQQDVNTSSERANQENHAPFSSYAITDHSEALIAGDGVSEPTVSRYKVKDQSAALISFGGLTKPSTALPAAKDSFQDLTSVEGHIEPPVSRYKVKDNAATLIKLGADAEPRSSKYKIKDMSADLIKAGAESESAANCYRTKIKAVSLIDAGATMTRRENANNLVAIKSTDVEKTSEFEAEDDFDWDSLSNDLDLLDAEDATREEGNQDHRQLKLILVKSPRSSSVQPHHNRLPNDDDLDDLDDSVFDQFTEDHEDDVRELPPSAQVEVNCFSSDPLSKPTSPSLMPPPPLPVQMTPPKTIAQPENLLIAATPGAPFSPFLRLAPAKTATVTSQIPDLKPASRIPTCFRIVELLRHLNSPTPPPTIELFATIKSSARNFNGTNQSFTFADLFFPQRPPYLQGIFSSCTETELFDDDSRSFLNAGRHGLGILARAIIRAKPKGNTKRQVVFTPLKGFHIAPNADAPVAMELEILSIWACQWCDVDYTKGIVMSEEEERVKKEGEKSQTKYVQEKKKKFTPLRSISGNLVKGGGVTDGKEMVW